MTTRNDKIRLCYSDHMFLIDTLPVDVDHPLEKSYMIMGSTGNPYQVTISNYPRCTCPDNQLNGRRCKHIFFVLLRIMKATNTNRRKYSDSELVSMYVNTPPIEKHLIYQGKKPKIKEGVAQKFDEGDQCPICLESLENGKELDYCKYSCGKTIHKECHNQWKVSKGNICVYCRGNWYEDGEEFYQKKVSYHPIKRKENSTNNDNNQNKDQNQNQDQNKDQNNTNLINTEEENFAEINEKIDLILKNASIRDEEENREKAKLKLNKKRGRKKKEPGSKTKRTRKKNSTNETNQTNGTNGTNGNNGTNVTNGNIGNNGTNGNIGNNGTNVTNGTNGTNGTNVTNAANGTNGTNENTNANNGTNGTEGAGTKKKRIRRKKLTNETNGANGTNGTEEGGTKKKRTRRKKLTNGTDEIQTKAKRIRKKKVKNEAGGDENKENELDLDENKENDLDLDENKENGRKNRSRNKKKIFQVHNN